MREYIATFNLSYVTSQRLKGNDGWRDEWDDHVLHITDELVNEKDTAAEKAWKIGKATSDVSETIELDFWAPQCAHVISASLLPHVMSTTFAFWDCSATGHSHFHLR
jgi:hypothetical protein